MLSGLSAVFRGKVQGGMLKLWRRHRPKCPHRNKGRDYTNCRCPIFADGELNGERYRKTLKTRDWQRAIRKIAQLESPEAPRWKPVKDAVEAFEKHYSYLESSTKRKYKNILGHFLEYADKAGIEAMAEFTVDHIDEYRAGRELAKTTATKELQLLRQFFGFCFDRKWVDENIAKRVKPPTNVKPKPVEPYTSAEIIKIIAACDQFGRTSYERLRARAMVLLMRYTALAISDVATLARDSVRDGEILVFRQKTGNMVRLPIPPDLEMVLEALPAPRGVEGEPTHYFWNPDTMTRRCVVGVAERTMAAVFKKSEVANAHAHRFRHTLATEILAKGGSDQDAADVLGNSPLIIRKHYAKWNVQRQDRIKSLMQLVHSGPLLAHTKKAAVSV
jgi:site-specific recombinase XerD